MRVICELSNAEKDSRTCLLAWHIVLKLKASYSYPPTAKPSEIKIKKKQFASGGPSKWDMETYNLNEQPITQQMYLVQIDDAAPVLQ